MPHHLKAATSYVQAQNRTRTNMKFRFYHGTSSIFLNSIIEFGLGGINPNIKYKNLELLQYLSLECEQKISNKEEYLVIRDASLGMANQNQ